MCVWPWSGSSPLETLSFSSDRNVCVPPWPWALFFWWTVWVFLPHTSHSISPVSLLAAAHRVLHHCHADSWVSCSKDKLSLTLLHKWCPGPHRVQHSSSRPLWWLLRTDAEPKEPANSSSVEMSFSCTFCHASLDDFEILPWEFLHDKLSCFFFTSLQWYLQCLRQIDSVREVRACVCVWSRIVYFTCGNRCHFICTSLLMAVFVGCPLRDCRCWRPQTWSRLLISVLIQRLR